MPYMTPINVIRVSDSFYALNCLLNFVFFIILLLEGHSSLLQRVL